MGGVEPEDRLAVLGAGAVHAQLDPVADGGVLGLAHPVDVAGVDGVAEDSVAGGVGDDDGTLGGDLKGLVVAAVLPGLLRHESNIGNVASGSPVELAVLLAVLDDAVVHGGVGAGGDDALNLLQLVILVPHLTTIT